MKESEVQKLITEYLETKKIFFIRCNSGSIFLDGRRIRLCPIGTPDLFILIDGKPIFVELKRDEKTHKLWKRKWQNFKKTSLQTPYNSRSVSQHKRMQEITNAGGICISTWSLDGLLKDLESLNIKL